MSEGSQALAAWLDADRPPERRAADEAGEGAIRRGGRRRGFASVERIRVAAHALGDHGHHAARVPALRGA